LFERQLVGPKFIRLRNSPIQRLIGGATNGDEFGGDCVAITGTKPLLNSISARRRQMIIYGAALSLSQQHSSSFRRCYTRVIILTRTPTFDHNINNNPHGCGSKRRTSFERPITRLRVRWRRHFFWLRTAHL